MAVGLLATTPGLAGSAQATPGASSHRGCPAPEKLVPSAGLAHHRSLASGVTLAHGTVSDSNGSVDIRTVTVSLTNKALSFEPLARSLSTRSPLSSLTSGHSHLVAATNTGYFVMQRDGSFGPPILPFISKSAPVVLSTEHQPVFGFTAQGTAQTGNVWLLGSVFDGGRSAAVTSINEVDPPSGIALYTSAWGRTVDDGDEMVSRTVSNGALGHTVTSYDGTSVPSAGDLLVAHGSKAKQWLTALPSTGKVIVSTAVHTDAPKPFVQAYGTGVTLLDKSGAATSGHVCERNQQPARTAIGYKNNGKTVIIAIVADHPYTSEHGLDEDQMASLMVQLGAQQAATLDGSGSTELLARDSATAKLTPQNYLADGAERPMPLGLGLVSVPVKAAKHGKAAKKTTKHTSKKAKKTSKG